MSDKSARAALPQTIATERLLLRAPSMADLDQLVALLDNPRVSATTAVIPSPYTEADGRFFIEHTATDAALRAYAIIDGDDQLTGVVSFKFQDGKSPELGYWIGEPFWGRGYACEAANGLLDAARVTGLFPRINARALSSNGASLRVLEKAGFVVTEITASVIERHLGQPIHVFAWQADR
ncbi:GNAT family N-acetyltransferase [Devosia sp.]|uniref:GNAT family N-acetyltransferase n=1 Tax=Devosia sp. TaxID=1871048 RepID=UPI003264E8E4